MTLLLLVLAFLSGLLLGILSTYRIVANSTREMKEMQRFLLLLLAEVTKQRNILIAQQDSNPHKEM